MVEMQKENTNENFFETEIDEKWTKILKEAVIRNRNLADFLVNNGAELTEHQRKLFEFASQRDSLLLDRLSENTKKLKLDKDSFTELFWVLLENTADFNINEV